MKKLNERMETLMHEKQEAIERRLTVERKLVSVALLPLFCFHFVDLLLFSTQPQKSLTR